MRKSKDRKDPDYIPEWHDDIECDGVDIKWEELQWFCPNCNALLTEEQRTKDWLCPVCEGGNLESAENIKLKIEYKLVDWYIEKAGRLLTPMELAKIIEYYGLERVNEDLFLGKIDLIPKSYIKQLEDYIVTGCVEEEDNGKITSCFLLCKLPCTFAVVSIVYPEMEVKTSYNDIKKFIKIIRKYENKVKLPKLKDVRNKKFEYKCDECPIYLINENGKGVCILGLDASPLNI